MNKDESSILIACPGCNVIEEEKRSTLSFDDHLSWQLDYVFLTQIDFQRRRKYFFLLLRKPFNIAFDDKRDKHNKVGLSLVKF